MGSTKRSELRTDHRGLFPTFCIRLWLIAEQTFGEEETFSGKGRQFREKRFFFHVVRSILSLTIVIQIVYVVVCVVVCVIICVIKTASSYKHLMFVPNSSCVLTYSKSNSSKNILPSRKSMILLSFERTIFLVSCLIWRMVQSNLQNPLSKNKTIYRVLQK